MCREVTGHFHQAGEEGGKGEEEEAAEPRIPCHRVCA